VNTPRQVAVFTPQLRDRLFGLEGEGCAFSVENSQPTIVFCKLLKKTKDFFLGTSYVMNFCYPQ
jgi:hypothetical protein